MSFAMWYVIASVMSLCLVDVDSYGVTLLNASVPPLSLGFFWDDCFSHCNTLFMQHAMVLVKRVCCATLLRRSFRQARPAQHLAVVDIILFKSKIPPNNGGWFMFWHKIRFCTSRAMVPYMQSTDSQWLLVWAYLATVRQLYTYRPWFNSNLQLIYADYLPSLTEFWRIFITLHIALICILLDFIIVLHCIRTNTAVLN